MYKYHVKIVLLYMRFHVRQADLKNYLRVVTKHLYFVTCPCYLHSLARASRKRGQGE